MPAKHPALRIAVPAFCILAVARSRSPHCPRHAAARLPPSAEESNPYAYAQTSEDLLGLPAEIELVAQQNAIATPRIAVIAADPWPLPWYLRHYAQVGFWQPGQQPGPADFYITSTDAANQYGDQLQNFHPDFFGVRPGVLILLWSPAPNEIRMADIHNSTIAPWRRTSRCASPIRKEPMPPRPRKLRSIFSIELESHLSRFRPNSDIAHTRTARPRRKNAPQRTRLCVPQVGKKIELPPAAHFPSPPPPCKHRPLCPSGRLLSQPSFPFVARAAGWNSIWAPSAKALRSTAWPICCSVGIAPPSCSSPEAAASSRATRRKIPLAGPAGWATTMLRNDSFLPHFLERLRPGGERKPIIDPRTGRLPCGKTAPGRSPYGG